MSLGEARKHWCSACDAGIQHGLPCPIHDIHPPITDGLVDVPPMPTDEEMANLPILDLAEFERRKEMTTDKKLTVLHGQLVKAVEAARAKAEKAPKAETSYEYGYVHGLERAQNLVEMAIAVGEGNWQ